MSFLCKSLKDIVDLKTKIYFLNQAAVGAFTGYQHIKQTDGQTQTRQLHLDQSVLSDIFDQTEL